jgi:hypothetical protein
MCAAYLHATPDPDSPAKVPIFVHEGRTMIESGLVAKYVATAFEVRRHLHWGRRKVLNHSLPLTL